MSRLRIKVRSLMRRVFYALPEWASAVLHKAVLLYGDIRDSIQGTRSKFTPPRGRTSVGRGDFDAIGKEFLGHFVDICHLNPSEKVLDVGCGNGRMAGPLADYLDETAVYEGFDIVPYGIKWCQRKISAERPSFHFQLADIYNKAYNNKGRYKASEYRFPYGDGTFDFAFATSVFTHMLADDMEHYLAEISRVLNPKGRCLITYFLLNDESRDGQAKGRSSHKFSHQIGRCWTTHKWTPEASIAHDENDVLRLYDKYGLSVVPPVYYGAWCGRKEFLSMQDIVVARKK